MHEHRYVEFSASKVRGGYFKIGAKTGICDQSLSFSMLYCEGCGETKEVVCTRRVPELAALTSSPNDL
jgi:hypothetical protein